mmetsp:Transcript_23295/g.34530  ORF Transcript_23295/g.34530 Transcript_23295/m.34530 type:complete len:97 (-) Transcript_23295:57-347(-)
MNELMSSICFRNKICSNLKQFVVLLRAVLLRVMRQGKVGPMLLRRSCRRWSTKDDVSVVVLGLAQYAFRSYTPSSGIPFWYIGEETCHRLLLDAHQ